MIIQHDFGAARVRRTDLRIPPVPFLDHFATDANVTVLMVGFGELISIFGSVDGPARVTCLSFGRFFKLDFSEFHDMGFDLVFSPLFTPSFDAHDSARRLSEIGFKGKYRAVVDRAPFAKMVIDEISCEFPDLDFEITETNPFGF